jgi:uncharacterized membrane protein YhiD involved in acid resistance
MSFNITTDLILLIIVTFLICITLSLILVATYYNTTSKPNKTEQVNYLQALVLMPSVAAMIMQSIGNSIALGFGIFGALAIIRFRTNIADLKDIAFIFCAMAIGIACGVNSFIVAIVGTLLFCIVAFILHFKFAAPFLEQSIETTETEDFIKIKVLGLVSVQKKKTVDAIFQEYCSSFQLLRYRYSNVQNQTVENGEVSEHEYKLTLNDFQLIDVIKTKINEIQEVSVDRIIFVNKLNTLNNMDYESKV